MGKVEKTRFERNWTTFVKTAFCASCKSPTKMVIWNWPCGIRSQGCFFVSPRWGKSKKRVLNAIGRHSSKRLFALLAKAQPKWWHETDLVEFDPKGVFSFCPDGERRRNAFSTQLDDVRQPGFSAAWKSQPKIVVWNRPRGIRSQACFFFSPRLGKSKKRVFNAIGRPSSTRLFALPEKAHPNWWYETDLEEFDPKGVFSFRPDWESRKNAFLTQLDDLRKPGFLRCLEKPTQYCGMKPPSWNSIPSVFCRFATIRKVEETSFQRNWTLFVNPAFRAAWKSQPKIVVWNRPRGIRSQGCFFFVPIGKVEKTSFQRNWTTFVNPAFCAAWKSPPKMVVWNRTRGIRSQGFFSFRPVGESQKTAFSTQLDVLCQPGFLRCFEKPTQNGGMKPTSLKFNPKGAHSVRPGGESRKKAFWTQLDDLRQPGFSLFLEKPTQNGGMKPTSCNSIPRLFIRLVPIGKVERTRFKRNWITFVNPALCAAWKRPPKIVVWSRPRVIRSQGFLFASPRWGKLKKRVLNAIGRPSPTLSFCTAWKSPCKMVV